MIDLSKVRYDRDYLYFMSDKTIATKKKITGHSFVDVAGLNPFTARGDAILSLVGIKKDEVDKKYLNRGEIAEELVRTIYEKKLKKNITWYDEEAKKENHYDFFPKYVQCGGIPDIELFDENTLVEVKSKSMKDYEKIKKSGALTHELYQGLYYGYLRRFDKITMFYVFFDEKSEEEAFKGLKLSSYKDLKFLSQEYTVDRENIEFLLRSDLNYYNQCINEKKIPLYDLSKKTLMEIGAVENAL